MNFIKTSLVVTALVFVSGVTGYETITYFSKQEPMVTTDQQREEFLVQCYNRHGMPIVTLDNQQQTIVSCVLPPKYN